MTPHQNNSHHEGNNNMQPSSVAQHLFPALNQIDNTPRLHQSTITSNRHPSDMLPSIPSNTIKKIQSGEFVNFEHLLPSAATFSTNDFAIHLNSDATANNNTFSITPRSASKSRIRDLHSWLLAWNNYYRTVIHFKPSLASQLAYYSSMIAQYANQYAFNDVLNFDTSFRMRMATDPALRWDRHDQELVSRFLRTSRPVCFRCNNFGHLSTNCPVPSSRRNTHNGPAQNTAHTVPPFLAPQRASQNIQRQHDNHTTHNRPTGCYYYNAFGHCESRRCQYPHVCSSCNGPHPKVHCPQRNTRN